VFRKRDAASIADGVKDPRRRCKSEDEARYVANGMKQDDAGEMRLSMADSRRPGNNEEIA